MRKYLLFVFAAFTAMTVNAQKLTPQANDKSIAFAKRPVLVNNIKMNPEIIGKAKKMSAAAAHTQKAPAKESIFGNYIEDMTDDIHVCSGATLSSFTIDGKDSVKFVLDNQVVTIHGTYDAETGIIDFGAQEFAGGGNAEGYDFVIYGIRNDSTVLDLSFTIDDNKNITCNQEGYVMFITTKGEYEGYTWDGAHFDPAFYPENAVQAGYTNGRSTQNQWAEYSMPVAVEDFDFSVNVYGFCGYGCLSIDINEDGTVTIPTGQPLVDPGFSEEQAATYGQYFNFTGVDLTDDGGISTNTDKPSVTGTIKGNVITIGEYFRICSLFDENGSGYAENWYADETTITLNEGNYLATGIKEVTTTREEMVKNAKTYNVMGQQVNRATKGLVIRNGKKFLNK